MFSKITVVALAGLLSVVAAVPVGGSALPSTLIISVVDATGVILGTLNGYGNFSSPGPSYPFRATTLADGYANLRAYGTCSANGVLACGVDNTVTPGKVYQLGGNVVLDGTDGLWSVDAVNDNAGGLNPFGLKYGIPVHVGGKTAAIPVTLSVHAAQG